MGNIVVGVEGDVYWGKGARPRKSRMRLRRGSRSETFTGFAESKVRTVRCVPYRLLGGRHGRLLYATGGHSRSEAIKWQLQSYSALPPIFAALAIASQGRPLFGATHELAARFGCGAETQVFCGREARGKYRFTRLRLVFQGRCPVKQTHARGVTLRGTNCATCDGALNRLTVGVRVRPRPAW